MLKYEIIFRVSLCSTACMHRGISAGDSCETPHNYSFKPKWHLKVIFSSKQNACHKLLWNLSFHGFLYRQLEPQRVLSLTDRCDSSIYYSTAQSRVQKCANRVQISSDIVRLFGKLVIWIAGYLDSWLFCTVKRPCLTSRLSALRFSIRFAFLALWEMSKETWQKKAFGEWITY